MNKATICLAPLLLAFFWNTAELVTLFRRREKRRGIHPGVAVAAELILWAAMVASIALLARNISLGVYWSYDEKAYMHENVEIGLLTMVVLLLYVYSSSSCFIKVSEEKLTCMAPL